MEWEQALGQALFRLVPAGWFDQNKLSLCRVHERYLQALAAAKAQGIVPLDNMRELDAQFEKWRRRPYDMLTGFLMPAMGRAVARFARVQSWADLAQVACALERYRLANGQFPETLEALAPKFIAKLPHDVINGQPLKYQRTDDGQFVLYSVGSNETDDGGTVALTKNGNLDQNKGDWVWRYPAK
jgi:Tfp pilus assembly protein PilE